MSPAAAGPLPGDLPGGPGWILRADDLRPRITDLAAFRQGLGGDALAAPVELLWSGDPAAALALLDQLPPSPRVRALSADCLRDLGEHDRAIDAFDALVEEAAGTAREATMRQHRGKALLAAGETARAETEFAIAVALRRGGDPALLASSEQALAVVRSRLARANRLPSAQRRDAGEAATSDEEAQDPATEPPVSTRLAFFSSGSTGDYRALGEQEQLALATGGDLETRFALAGIEGLPTAVQLALVADTDETVRAGLLTSRYVDAAAVRLAERRETDPELLHSIALQLHASVDRKRTTATSPSSGSAAAFARPACNARENKGNAASATSASRRDPALIAVTTE